MAFKSNFKKDDKVIWTYDGIYNGCEFYIKEIWDGGDGKASYSLTDIETKQRHFGGGLIKESELTLINA